MKRLVIHPKDESTIFLNQVYSHLDNVTLVQSGVEELRNLNTLIAAHDQIIFLGHGMQEGLLSVGQFGYNTFVMNAARAHAIKDRVNSVFIWCYASDFVVRNDLRGFATGMFISEEIEALAHGVECTAADIEISNQVFATALGEALQRNLETLDLYNHVKHQYAPLTETNPVVKYNWELVEGIL
jgi:hypothetical protein